LRRGEVDLTGPRDRDLESEWRGVTERRGDLERPDCERCDGVLERDGSRAALRPRERDRERRGDGEGGGGDIIFDELEARNHTLFHN
jgi:hypothetical protein